MVSQEAPGGHLAGDLNRALDEARAFAFDDYLVALTKGNRLTSKETEAVAQRVVRYTGLSPEYIIRANLRVSPQRFRKELLRDRRLMVGRLDSRYTGIDADAAGETQEFDPSNTALQGAYTALFNDYVRRELKWDQTSTTTRAGTCGRGTTANINPSIST